MLSGAGRQAVGSQGVACGVSETFGLLKTVPCRLAAEESSPPVRVSSSDKTRVLSIEC